MGSPLAAPSQQVGASVRESSNGRSKRGTEVFFMGALTRINLFLRSGVGLRVRHRPMTLKIQWCSQRVRQRGFGDEHIDGPGAGRTTVRSTISATESAHNTPSRYRPGSVCRHTTLPMMSNFETSNEATGVERATLERLLSVAADDTARSRHSKMHHNGLRGRTGIPPSGRLATRRASGSELGAASTF